MWNREVVEGWADVNRAHSGRRGTRSACFALFAIEWVLMVLGSTGASTGQR